jgi:hypothetical protein
MNAYEMTTTRELTAQELDQVTGGAGWTYGMDNWELGAVTFGIAMAIGGAVLGLLDWLFD